MSPAATADPRMRARKAAVRRAAGRRRLRVVLSVLVVAAAVTGGLVALHSPLFSARRLLLSGAVHETRAEVLAVTGLSRRPPLVDLDLGRAESALERLPWVATASVTRRWPDGVGVVVVERRPLATVRLAAGRAALLDGAGRVLADVAAPPRGLARLALPGPPPPPGGFLPAADRPMLAAAAALPVALLGEVRSIADGADGVLLHLAAGGAAVLGQAVDLHQKMVGLMTLLDRAHLGRFSLIDLRVASAPVLTR